MIENIIIGKPLVKLSSLLGVTDNDESFINTTVVTNERFLPTILKQLKLVPSSSWVKKNKPELFIALNEPALLEISLGKKKPPIWIVVGE